MLLSSSFITQCLNVLFHFTSFATKNCSQTLDMRCKSTFPPDITATTFFPLIYVSTFPASRASSS